MSRPILVLVLVSIAACADDAPPMRARVAFDATITAGTPDAPAFPETAREPFCNLFR
jgi:hypothetical protein